MKNIVPWFIAPSIVLIGLSASAQSPAFEVVSLRPTQIAADGAAIESPPNGDGITMRNVTAHEMIDYAYSFRHPELVSGLPEWAKTKNYDLAAKVADADLATFPS